MQIYPNPSDGKFVIKFNLRNKSDITLTVNDLDGNEIKRQTFNTLPAGENRLIYTTGAELKDAIYIITIETPYERTTQKVNLTR